MVCSNILNSYVVLVKLFGPHNHGEVVIHHIVDLKVTDLKIYLWFVVSASIQLTFVGVFLVILNVQFEVFYRDIQKLFRLIIDKS